MHTKHQTAGCLILVWSFKEIPSRKLMTTTWTSWMFQVQTMTSYQGAMFRFQLLVLRRCLKGFWSNWKWMVKLWDARLERENGWKMDVRLDWPCNFIRGEHFYYPCGESILWNENIILQRDGGTNVFLNSVHHMLQDLTGLPQEFVLCFLRSCGNVWFMHYRNVLFLSTFAIIQKRSSKSPKIEFLPCYVFFLKFLLKGFQNWQHW